LAFGEEILLFGDVCFPLGDSSLLGGGNAFASSLAAAAATGPATVEDAWDFLNTVLSGYGGVFGVALFRIAFLMAACLPGVVG